MRKYLNYLGDSCPKTMLSHSCSVNGVPMTLDFALVKTGFFGLTVGLTVVAGAAVVLAAPNAALPFV